MKFVSNRYKYTIVLLLGVIILGSCNKNSTSWINRTYQNTTARYNIYYNGTIKLDEGIQTLALNHKEDYNGVLDVFPYGDEGQAKAMTGAMDEIIAKGSKIILDRPVSKWVDDAYLLVGKGYFFKGEYYAAIETFQIINTRFKNTELAQEATIWILKSYLMLKRYDDAEALVSILKNEKNFPPRLVGLFAAASADVYIKQKKYQPALANIKIALSDTRKRSKKARYSYITAQLFEKMGNSDSTKYYLRRVLKLNPPYEMAFNAKISLARNYDPKDKNQVRAARRYLRGMLRDDKNISYYDQIYYQLGIIEMRDGNTDQAIKNLELSLRNNQNNQNQKAHSYITLADIYFNKPDYTLAQLYYDSTVQVIQPGFEDYASIVKKQSVLSELIKYKIILAREDSLQYLATLSPSELDKRVERWIKQEEEQRKRAEEEKEKNKDNPGGAGGGGFPGIPGQPGQPPFGQQPGGGSKWYFYDQQQMTIGYNDFIRRWGNRKLTDDWRFSQKEKEITNTPGNNNQQPDTNQIKGTDPETNPQGGNAEDNAMLANIPEAKRKYYRDIPFSEEAKKLSDEKVASSLFSIGMIYYEKLEDIPEAINAFEMLVSRFPGSEYEPRAYYYLYKINKEHNPPKADEYKNLLVTKFPNTDYAILVNEGVLKRNAPDAIDWHKTDFYNTTYQLFTSQRFNEVKSRRTVADTMLEGTLLMPKYDLLYAMSVGKTESLENYKQQLNKVIETYPATEVSRKATDLLEATQRVEKKDTATAPARDIREDVYKFKPQESHYALIVMPNAADITMIQISISNYNSEKYPDETFEVIPTSLNPTQQVILIRTFAGKDKALDYITDIEKFHAFYLKGVPRNDAEYLVIDPQNYGELQKQKELAPYKAFYKRYYSK